jgi:hypothetical protein
MVTTPARPLTSALSGPLLRLLVPALLVLAASLVPMLPLLVSANLPTTHEGLRYVCLSELFRRAFLGGVAYPRWLPDLAGGYGYPLFVFYQPGYFYLTLLLSVVSVEPALLHLLSLMALSLVGTTGAYLLVRQHAGRIIALFGAAMFVLTPYLYVNLYVRGDWSELGAMMLTPWPLFFLSRWATQASSGQRRGFGASMGMALSLAGIVVSHPITAMFYAPVFVVVAYASGLDIGPIGRRTFLRETSLAIACALLLSSPYWFTVIEMRKYVNLEAAFVDHYQSVRNVVHPRQLFRRGWGFGASAAANGSDEMSLQLGLLHFAVAVFGAILARRSRTVRASFLCYLVLVVAMTPVATLVWRLPLLRTAQFPWRILSVTAVLQALCCAGLERAFPRSLPKKLGAAMALLIIGAIWYAPQFSVNPAGRSAPISYSYAQLQSDLETRTRREFHVFSLQNEFLPKTAQRQRPAQPRGDAAMVLGSPGTTTHRLPGDSPYRISYRIDAHDGGAALVNQLYLPGWRAVVNGVVMPRALLEKYLTVDGRMVVPVPAGSTTVEAWYDGPPGWPLRDLVILLGMAAYLAWNAGFPRTRGHFIRKPQPNVRQ